MHIDRVYHLSYMGPIIHFQISQLLRRHYLNSSKPTLFKINATHLSLCTMCFRAKILGGTLALRKVEESGLRHIFKTSQHVRRYQALEGQ